MPPHFLNSERLVSTSTRQHLPVPYPRLASNSRQPGFFFVPSPPTRAHTSRALLPYQCPRPPAIATTNIDTRPSWVSSSMARHRLCWAALPNCQHSRLSLPMGLHQSSPRPVSRLLEHQFQHRRFGLRLHLLPSHLSPRKHSNHRQPAPTTLRLRASASAMAFNTITVLHSASSLGLARSRNPIPRNAQRQRHHHARPHTKMMILRLRVWVLILPEARCHLRPARSSNTIPFQLCATLRLTATT